MRGFTACGKQVQDSAGVHFADAASPVAALLIVAALNFRQHRPVVDGEAVICSRCQSALPEEGDAPCVARAPRCDATPDMFGGLDMPHTGTEPRPCHCGEPASMTINNEPLCAEHGAAAIKEGADHDHTEGRPARRNRLRATPTAAARPA